MVVLALVLVGVADLGADARADRVPADRGPGLPDRRRATARRRVEGADGCGAGARSRDRRGKVPGVEHVVTVSGISILDNLASLANAGVAFVVLKDWDVRLKEPGQDVRTIALQPERRPARRAGSFRVRAPPAADPGHRQRRRLHHAGRTQERQFRLRPAAEPDQRRGRECAMRNPSLQRVATTFRAGAPQIYCQRRPRSRRRRSASPSDRCSPPSPAMSDRTMSARFNKFGHVFQIYTQADAKYRANVDDIRNLKVKAGDGTMTPIGTVVDVKRSPGPSAHQPLQSLPVVDHRRRPGARVQLGAGPRHHGADRQRTSCRPGRASSGPRCPTRRSRSARRSTSCSASRCCSSISFWRASTRAGSCPSR